MARKSLNKTKYGQRMKKNQELSALEAFTLGLIARTIATVVVFPYLRAKVMLQSSSAINESQSSKPISIPQMLMKIYEKDGFMALFQGLGPELTRGVFSAALMLMAKEKISGIVKARLKVQ